MHKEVRHVLIALPIIVVVAAAITLLRGPSTPRTPTPAPAPAAEADGTIRIAALSPAFGAILADLHAADLVVARHGFDRHLPASIPVGGDQGGIDYEALLRAQPTHVLTQWGARELPPRLVTLSEREGWSLHDHRLLTAEDIAAATMDVAAIAGRKDEARALVDRLERVLAEPDDASVLAARRSLGPVLLLGAVQPAAAFGPGSWHHELLVRQGFTNAAPEHAGAWVNLDAEDVLRLSPRAIVLVRATPGTPSEPGQKPAPGSIPVRVHTGDEAGAALGRLATLDTPARDRGALIVLDHPLSMIPGTHAAALGEALARALDELIHD